MVSLIFVIRPLFPGILGSYPPFQQGAVLVCAVEQQRALLLKYSPSGLKLGLDNVYSIPSPPSFFPGKGYFFCFLLYHLACSVA